MTFNTQDLRDGHLPLVERIDIALRRVTNGEGQMRVPVEATDPDIVLHNCRDRITELEAEISRRPLPAETRIDVHAYDNRISKLRAELDAKDKRIAELEQLAALTPIKVGDISITLGLTETGEARMTFDGADDATLAVVAGKFALAMQATMESAKDVPNA